MIFNIALSVLYLVFILLSLCLAFIILFYRKPKQNEKTSKQPYVTIQVVTCGEPFEIIKKTLEACISQKYPKYEVIVSDDFRNKQLNEFCKKHKIKIVHRKTNKGFKAGALNNLLKYSRGDVIAVIDADDIIPVNFLSETVRLLGDNVGFVQAQTTNRNSSLNKISSINSMLYKIFFQAFSSMTPFYRGSCAVIRKDAIKKSGGWSEEVLAEDVSITLKIRNAGFSSSYAENVKCSYLAPETFSVFLNQITRWSYGTTQVFMDFIKKKKIAWKCMAYTISLIMMAVFLLSLYLTFSSNATWITQYLSIVFVISIFMLMLILLAERETNHKQKNTSQFCDSSTRISDKAVFYLLFHGLSLRLSLSVLKAMSGTREKFITTHGKNKKPRSLFIPETILGLLGVIAALSNPGYMSLVLLIFSAGFLLVPVLGWRYK